MKFWKEITQRIYKGVRRNMENDFSEALLSALDEGNDIIYLSDPENYKLYYLNKKAKSALGNRPGSSGLRSSVIRCCMAMKVHVIFAPAVCLQIRPMNGNVLIRRWKNISGAKV
jgi:hypothetical protein